METADHPSPFISFTSDYGFKVTFGNEEKTLFLRRALQALIGGERPIVDVVFDKTTFDGTTKDSRSGVYDLACTDDAGNSFIVEMQVAEFGHFMQRLKFYGFQKFNTLIRKGNFNYGSLPKVYCIGILASSSSSLTDYHHLGSIKNQHGEEMDNQMEFITIEMDKFNKQGEACTTDLDKLIFTMKALNNVQQSPTQYPRFWTEEWLKIAIQELDTRAMSPEQRMAYEMTLAYNAQAIQLEKEKMDAAEAKGKAEGLAEGEAKAKAEASAKIEHVAQQMITLGMTDENIAALLQETLEFVQNIRLDMAKAAAEQKQKQN
jgi:predicted transposase/invertase (TIGR01784 family)